MDSSNGHVCPRPVFGMLPSKIADHATAGRTKEVFEWIEKGGDINAGDDVGQTLMHIACQEDHIELLKKLLEHPSIHLNPRSSLNSGLTPLALAVALESTTILEMLINAKSTCCVLNYSSIISKPQNTGKTSAILSAAQGHKWQAVRLLWQHYQDIREWEAFGVFAVSAEAFQYDIAKTVINSKFSFKEQDFSILIQEVYQYKQWELLEAIFRKNIHYNNDTVLKVFIRMCHQKDWVNLENYLSILNGEVKIHSELLQNILDRNKTEAEKILETVRGNEKVLIGTLLAACIGGTSEELAELLLKQQGACYSDLTLDNAFLLAVMNRNIEFIQNLLSLRRYSLKMFFRARSVSRGSLNCTDVVILVTRLIEERIKTISEVEKIKENNN